MGLDSSFRKAGRKLGIDVKALFEDAESYENFDPGRGLSRTAQGRGYGLTLRPQQRDAITTSLSFTPIGRLNEGQPSDTETDGVNQEESTSSEENTAPQPEVATTRVSSFDELARRYGFDRRIRGSRSGTGRGVYMPDNIPIAVDYVPDKKEDAEEGTDQTVVSDDPVLITDFAPDTYTSRRTRGRSMYLR
tara:strand:- start:7209 stop:7781 length:573 start_codon:yes stop_codon:yes gene_type:complete